MTTEFDDRLRQRLLAFQEDNHLTGDGVAGTETWSRLLIATGGDATAGAGTGGAGAGGALYAQVVARPGQHQPGAGHGAGGHGQGSQGGAGGHGGTGHGDAGHGNAGHGGAGQTGGGHGGQSGAGQGGATRGGGGQASAAGAGQEEMLADDPFPGTSDGEQPQLLGMSEEGMEFLARHEGVRLRLYNDSQGHCTIGVGHLVHRGPCDGSEPERFRRGLTREEVMTLFREDLTRFENAVQNGITSRVNQYQFDALVSFCFNVGTGAFAGSGVLRRVNAKQYSKVPEEMMRWVHPPEITGRRRDEAQLFRNGQY